MAAGVLDWGVMTPVWAHASDTPPTGLKHPIVNAMKSTGGFGFMAPYAIPASALRARVSPGQWRERKEESCA